MKKLSSGNVLSLYFEICGGWEQWFLLASDIHFDSVYCNRELLKSHLERARERQALVMVFGDLFDAMQGRVDPCRSMEELRPEYRRSDYYHLVVEDTARFFGQYSNSLDL